jgi:hypothetical protein
MHCASVLELTSRLARFALPALLALGGCAKAKSNETPGPSSAVPPPTEAGAAPASAPQSAGANLLCTDGLHKRGDHWKVACNVCRCGADGAILCSEFLCTTPVRDASRTD